MRLNMLRMQVSTKGLAYGIADTSRGYRENCQSWLTSSESDVQKSSLSNRLCEKMGGLAQPGQKVKQAGFSFQDQDSSSTQSTGQSHVEGIASSELGYHPMHFKTSQAEDKLSLSIGAYDYGGSPSSQVDYNQSLYFGGYVAAYGPQTVVPARVPLPIAFSHEPIFVNAKQYHGILRRRKHRAKLEAQNKLLRDRKPYIHESRHLHAMRRVRGTGGRFVNTKKVESSGPPMQTSGLSKGLTFDSGQNRWGLSGDHLLEEAKREDNNKSVASCSDVGSSCTSTGSDFYHHHQDIGLAAYPSQMGGDSMSHGGTGCSNYYI